MFFQGRGTVHLAEVVDGVVGPYKLHICPDTFTVDLAVDRWEHINKCGAQDVADASGDKASSGTVNFSFANVEDANYALAVLGTANDAMTGSIEDEQLPSNCEAGDFWFLGGLERHRGITNLVLTGGGVEDTDWEFDPISGRLTFITDQTGSPGPTASYDYADPPAVSMLTAGSKTWAVMFENINKQQANDPGSVELYKVRFSPASSMDYMSEEAQIPQITGTALADTTKLFTDTLYGQFGRRVL